MRLRSILIKKRMVWLPTIWGFLFLLIILGSLLFWAGRNLALFLTEQKPAPSQVLVVEGWLDKAELEQALTLFRSGHYTALITTGGPLYREINPQYKNYAERAATALLYMGLAQDKMKVVPAPASAQERTYVSAVMVRKYLEKTMNPMPISINVFSSGVHARRTFFMYQQAFRETSVKVGIIAAKPDGYSLTHWWQTSEGAKTVLTEFFGWLWMKCFFKPGAIGSHSELWGKP